MLGLGMQILEILALASFFCISAFFLYTLKFLKFMFIQAFLSLPCPVYVKRLSHMLPR